MRDIKFRIWDSILCVMYTPEDEEIGNLWEIPNVKGGVMIAREGIELMQWTGLKDRHGLDIYEGDIVSCMDIDWPAESRKEVTGTIVFSNGSFCLKSGELYNALWMNAEEIELQGNIYEHSELLTTL